MRRRVALLIETSSSYGRQILNGVAKYQKTHAPWSTFVEERELRAAPPTWLLDQSWDGILCRPTTPQLAVALKKKRIPTIDLNDIHNDLGLPRIQSDMRELGRVAAIHLHERGFRNFAFCGFTSQPWSQQRREGFQHELLSRGCDCSHFESNWRGRNESTWDADQRRLAEWLEKLPKPVAIMACNDMRGQQVLNACQRNGLFVPEQVAVIGVDNDELLCDFCTPPLSSVQPNPERIGYEAAQMLDQLMDGRKLPATTTLISPIGIITRQSTDALGVNDPDVVAAIAYIRDMACRGISVGDVVNYVALSRSYLERRFRKCLGHSPQQEIRLTQLKRIKQLLHETDLTLSEIAHLTGFTHTEYMTVVFKRMTSQSPRDYRRQVNVEA